MSLPPIDWTDATAEEALPQEKPLPPWEDPSLSILPALCSTLTGILRRPRSFFQTLPTTGGLGEPLGFALVVGTLGLLSSLIWQALLEGGLSESASGMLLTQTLRFLNTPKLIVGLFLLAPLLVAAGQFFLSMCLTWAVRLTGPSETTFEAVFRVAAYAEAPMLACLIPLVGSLAAAVWGFWVLVIGLGQTFNLTVPKAIFALILSAVFQAMLLLFLLLLGGLFIFRGLSNFLFS
ncbi:YIP1 family protein [Desulfobacca acetoxidans]